ncbi:hypothetical protein QN277_024348 [Acacia crassicarpa]|uniref:Uncharacterized protein n=1 Tax=Acacia crassicarpa TaxID=499986 RepID=A0AAE1JDJ8_9FABA|nr:hypothetical protein QN277_024348 [Acacia crassicarpa]
MIFFLRVLNGEHNTHILSPQLLLFYSFTPIIFIYSDDGDKNRLSRASRFRSKSFSSSFRFVGGTTRSSGWSMEEGLV